MTDGGIDDRVLDFPIPNPSALEPPEEWQELRARCPVALVTLPSGDEAALLTRYDDVRRVLSDRRFSRRLDAEDASRLTDTESGGLFNNDVAHVLPQDGAAHKRWRRPVMGVGSCSWSR